MIGLGLRSSEYHFYTLLGKRCHKANQGLRGEINCLLMWLVECIYRWNQLLETVFGGYHMNMETIFIRMCTNNETIIKN